MTTVLDALREAKRELLRKNAVPIAPQSKFDAHVHPDALFELEGDPLLADFLDASNLQTPPADALWQTSRDFPFALRLYCSSEQPMHVVTVEGRTRQGQKITADATWDAGAPRRDPASATW